MTDPAQIGALLTQARDAWQLTDDEVSERAGLPIETLREALAGSATVSDLALIASALGGSFDDLVRGRSFWLAPAVAFRGAPHAAQVPTVRRAILSLSHTARVRAQLGDLLELPKAEHKLRPTALAADIPAQAEELAIKVRKQLKNEFEPIACVRAAMRSLGVATFLARFGMDDVDGMSFRDDQLGVAVANADARDGAVTPLRSTFAHELCHLLFDGTKGKPLGIVDRRGDRASADLEKRANAFAAYLLAPRIGVSRFLRERGVKKGDSITASEVVALSEHFIMGVESVAWHLVSLRYWDDADVMKHRHLITRPLHSEDDAELRPRDSERVIPIERRGEILELASIALERGIIGIGRWREIVGVGTETDWMRILRDREMLSQNAFTKSPRGPSRQKARRFNDRL